MNKKLRFVFNILLIPVALIVSILFMEILVRIFQPQQAIFSEGTQSFEQMRGSLYLHDEELGYKSNPKAYPDWWEGTLNGKRHLGNDGQLPKDDKLNVLILGDSLIEDFLFLNAIEEVKVEKNKFRFFISGTPGYNTLQEHLYLTKHIGLKPDLLILQFCYNDFLPSETILKTSSTEKFQRQLFEPLSIYLPTLFKYSKLYQLIYTRTQNKKFFEPQPAIVEKGLEKFKKYSEENGIPLIVLVYPFIQFETPEYPFMKKILKRELAKNELEYIEAEEINNCKKEIARKAPDDYLHPSLNGHRIMAKKLWEKLESKFGTKVFEWPSFEC